MEREPVDMGPGLSDINVDDDLVVTRAIRDALASEADENGMINLHEVIAIFINGFRWLEADMRGRPYPLGEEGTE